MKSLSHVRLFATPWTIAYQAPLSMRFSRQEYWSGLPFPSPGDFPNPGIEPGSPAFAGRHFTIWATREAPITSLHPSVDNVLKTPPSLHKNFTSQKWFFVGEKSTFSACCFYLKLANVQRVKAIEVCSFPRASHFSEEMDPAVHIV